MPSNCINHLLQQYRNWGLATSAKPQLLRQLEGGLTNQSFLLELAGQRYVLRLFSAQTQQLNINRDAEYTIACLAAQHGLSPAPVYLCPDKNYSITHYVEADLFYYSTKSRADKLQQLAQSLQALHAIPVTGDLPSLIVADKAERYWQSAEQLAVSNDLLSHQQCLQDYFRQLPSITVPVLCHNDLVAENVLLSDSGLHLIDWEYSALGDPYFDLATVILNQQLSQQDEQWFLHSYSGNINEQKLQQAKQQVRYMEWLWWLLQKQAKQEFVNTLLQKLLSSIEFAG
ncbi:choline/ethanolamine kinase family protein [Dasania marina]|uniref:choline/ethanolamine kinase family protein n=1 Tax=Dasania marina TaxID=471499 RepID=UPI0030DAE52B